MALAVAPTTAAPDEAGLAPGEERSFTDPVQLTSEADFAKAGEAYFSPDGRWIVFQAVPAGAVEADRYSMFVAPLVRDERSRVVGLGRPVRVGVEGAAETCGWFHPTEPGRIIFGSTCSAPTKPQAPGYQRDSGRYRWAFPREMEVVQARFDPVSGRVLEGPAPLWERPGYDAECSFSPNGRFVLHTRVDEATGDADIWVFDTRDGSSTPLVQEKGYDGGPFFSPDGRRICYRSDRKGDNLLQVHVADLVFDEKTGAVTGIENEQRLTSGRDVDWAPYWDPSGRFLVYASSAVSHANYELFSVEVPPPGAAPVEPASLARRRITFAAGFDGLPAISPDGSLLLWTSQRRPGAAGGRGSSQIWIARVVDLAPW